MFSQLLLRKMAFRRSLVLDALWAHLLGADVDFVQRRAACAAGTATLTVGDGKPAARRAHFSPNLRLAFLVRRPAAAPLRRRSALLDTLFKHCKRALEGCHARLQLWASTRALTRVAFRLHTACAEWDAVNYLQEMLSGQRRPTSRPGWGEQGLHTAVATHRRRLFLPPCLDPSPRPFFVLCQLSSSMHLRPSLGQQRGRADSSRADGGAGGWRRPSLMLPEQETTWRGCAGVV